MLLAIDYELDTSKEIVVVAPEGRDGTGAMLARLRPLFVPNRVLAVAPEGAALEGLAAIVPWVDGKVARGGRTTAYVCENRVCGFPTADPDEFARQLRKVARSGGPEGSSGPGR
jgi:uncharacterized protein YyaL (SSP411 family)